MKVSPAPQRFHGTQAEITARTLGPREEGSPIGAGLVVVRSRRVLGGAGHGHLTKRSEDSATSSGARTTLTRLRPCPSSSPGAIRGCSPNPGHVSNPWPLTELCEPPGQYLPPSSPVLGEHSASLPSTAIRATGKGHPSHSGPLDYLDLTVPCRGGVTAPL